MDFVPFVLLAVGGSAAIAIWVIRRRREAARRESLERIARRIGLAWEAPVDGAPDDALAGLSALGRGRGRRATVVMRGTFDGLDAIVFEWEYTIGTGRDSRRIRHTICAFRRKRAAAGRGEPVRFELLPETIARRMGAAFGRTDFDFDDDPEFSRRYVLRGPDERAVRSTFRRALRRSLTRDPGWHAETTGEWIAWWKGRRPKPDDLRATLQSAARLTHQLDAD